MKLFNPKNWLAISAFALVALLSSAEVASAQGRSNKEYKNRAKQERKADKAEDKVDRKYDKEQAKSERKYNKERSKENWVRNGDDWRRDEDRNRVKSGYDRSRGQGHYIGNTNAHTNRDNDKRRRNYPNGSYYNTNERGVQILRQAVNEGYRQGFRTGRSDLDGRRGVSYSDSDMYRIGTYGYKGYVTQSQYQYYFRQGFQRGYDDGANTRYRDTNNNNYGQNNNGYGQEYNQRYQYGSSSNGVLSMLGSILGQIMNLRSY